MQKWRPLNHLQRGSLSAVTSVIPLPIFFHRHSSVPLKGPNAAALARKTDLPAYLADQSVRFDKQTSRFVNAHLPDVLSEGDALFTPESLTEGLVGDVHDLGNLPRGIDLSDVVFDVGRDPVYPFVPRSLRRRVGHDGYLGSMSGERDEEAKRTRPSYSASSGRTTPTETGASCASAKCPSATESRSG